MQVQSLFGVIAIEITAAKIIAKYELSVSELFIH